MRGGKMAGMVSAMLLMSGTVSAAVPDKPGGLASNRTALALAGPIDQSGGGCPVGDTSGCVQTASAGAQSGSHTLLLLGGVALAGGIAAAAASGHHHHHPVSP